jgi:PKD repeat protein
MGAYDAPPICDPIVGCQYAFPYTINWGDGSATQAQYYASYATEAATSHTFAKTGNYTVTMTARDKDGGAGTTSVKVSIK